MKQNNHSLQNLKYFFMKPQDYLHLYLGCQIMTPDGIGWLASVSRDRRKMDGLLLSNRINVDFKTIRHTKNSVDGYDKKRNYGAYLLEEENLIPLDTPNSTEPEITIPGGCKLILRLLNDIKEDELKFIFFICYQSVYDHQGFGTKFQFLSDRNTSEVGLKAHENVGGDRWEYGLTVSKDGALFSANGSFLNIPQFEVCQYLLSKHFDLFGLIDAGLAIDATQLPNSEQELQRSVATKV